MAKITISDITAAFGATTAINSRFQQIEDEFAGKVMYTDEISPMERDLDMAGHSIINVSNISSTGTPSIDATNVVVTPVGNIGAINAQAALAELDSEKAALAGNAAQNFAVNNLTVTGTVDGRDVSVDGTKLDTVETNADVTDAANVAAAGAMMDSDISPAEGILRKTGAGTYTAHKTNLGATGAPTVNDDSSAGYSINSEWVDLTNDNHYKLVDSTVGAAVWIMSGTSTPGGVSSVAATAPITSSGGATPTIALSDDGVTNTKLANMATKTIKGRTTAGTGDPEDLTAAQARGVLAGDTVTLGADAIRMSSATISPTANTEIEFDFFFISATVASISLILNADEVDTNYYSAYSVDAFAPTKGNNAIVISGPSVGGIMHIRGVIAPNSVAGVSIVTIIGSYYDSGVSYQRRASIRYNSASITSVGFKDDTDIITGLAAGTQLRIWYR